jgi:hypothetical protein
MSQTTIEKKPAAIPAPLGDLGAAFGLDAVQAAWAGSLAAGAETLRAIQAKNADFAGRMMELQLQAVQAFSPGAPLEARMAKPIELGASALRLWMTYLGDSAALAQKAAATSWAMPKA